MLCEHSVEQSRVSVDAHLVRVRLLLAIFGPLAMPSSPGRQRFFYFFCGRGSLRSTLDYLHTPISLLGRRAATRHRPRQFLWLGGAVRALPRLLVLGARRTPSRARRRRRILWLFWRRCGRVLRVLRVLRVHNFLKGLVNVRGFDRHF